MTPSSERWGCVGNLFLLALESKVYKDFLALVRLGIGTGTVSGFTFQVPIDWQGVKDLAELQGLGTIVLDGIEKLPDGQRPPQMVLLQWIGETLQSYEYRYNQYCKANAELAAFYNQNGFKMMVLKGYACSLEWPKPEHRPCGDIDIWLFGQQEAADAALAASSKFQVSKSKIDNSHHHHTVFEWGGFTVENHYDFINVNRHKSHKGLEPIFKDLGADDSHYVELNGEKVYLPSPNLHALFLLRHALNHFASIGINLRQVLDWAFYIEKHTKEIDWAWMEGIIDNYHMRDFYNCINAICVENLGFDTNIFPQVQFLPSLKEKVLADIIAPEFSSNEPSGFIKNWIYKYRRWKGNRWKHDLCYDESVWSTLWNGLMIHWVKPKANNSVDENV